MAHVLESSPADEQLPLLLAYFESLGGDSGGDNGENFGTSNEAATTALQMYRADMALVRQMEAMGLGEEYERRKVKNEGGVKQEEKGGQGVKEELDNHTLENFPAALAQEEEEDLDIVNSQPAAIHKDKHKAPPTSDEPIEEETRDDTVEIPDEERFEDDGMGHTLEKCFCAKGPGKRILHEAASGKVCRHSKDFRGKLADESKSAGGTTISVGTIKSEAGESLDTSKPGKSDSGHVVENAGTITKGTGEAVKTRHIGGKAIETTKSKPATSKIESGVETGKGGKLENRHIGGSGKAVRLDNGQFARSAGTIKSKAAASKIESIIEKAKAAELGGHLGGSALGTTNPEAGKSSNINAVKLETGHGHVAENAGPPVTAGNSNLNPTPSTTADNTNHIQEPEPAPPRTSFSFNFNLNLWHRLRTIFTYLLQLTTYVLPLIVLAGPFWHTIFRHLLPILWHLTPYLSPFYFSMLRLLTPYFSTIILRHLSPTLYTLLTHLTTLLALLSPALRYLQSTSFWPLLTTCFSAIIAAVRDMWTWLDVSLAQALQPLQPRCAECRPFRRSTSTTTVSLKGTGGCQPTTVTVSGACPVVTVVGVKSADGDVRTETEMTLPSPAGSGGDGEGTVASLPLLPSLAEYESGSGESQPEKSMNLTSAAGSGDGEVRAVTVTSLVISVEMDGDGNGERNVTSLPLPSPPAQSGESLNLTSAVGIGAESQPETSMNLTALSVSTESVDGDGERSVTSMPSPLSSPPSPAGSGESSAESQAETDMSLTSLLVSVVGMDGDEEQSVTSLPWPARSGESMNMTSAAREGEKLIVTSLVISVKTYRDGDVQTETEMSLPSPWPNGSGESHSESSMPQLSPTGFGESQSETSMLSPAGSAGGTDVRTETETELCLTSPARAGELTELSLPDFVETGDGNGAKQNETSLPLPSPAESGVGVGNGESQPETTLLLTLSAGIGELGPETCALSEGAGEPQTLTSISSTVSGEPHPPTFLPSPPSTTTSTRTHLLYNDNSTNIANANTTISTNSSLVDLSNYSTPINITISTSTEKAHPSAPSDPSDPNSPTPTPIPTPNPAFDLASSYLLLGIGSGVLGLVVIVFFVFCLKHRKHGRGKGSKKGNASAGDLNRHRDGGGSGSVVQVERTTEGSSTKTETNSTSYPTTSHTTPHPTTPRPSKNLAPLSQIHNPWSLISTETDSTPPLRNKNNLAPLSQIRKPQFSLSTRSSSAPTTTPPIDFSGNSSFYISSLHSCLSPLNV